MTQDKARDFFSAYYEGTLPGGLRQSLEQRLKVDSQLRSEYAAFERTMNELGDLREEEIEIPSYLSDRIATRLENVQDRRRVSPFSQWLPRIALGSLGLAAICGIFMAKGQVSTASVVPTANASAVPFASLDSDNQLHLHHVAAGTETVSITGKSNGLNREYHLTARQAVELKIQGSGSTSTEYQLNVPGQPWQFVVVPGTKRSKAVSGTGTVHEFAMAFASRYGQVVLIGGGRGMDETVSWNLLLTDAKAAVLQNVPDGFTGAVVSDGIVSIDGR